MSDIMLRAERCPSFRDVLCCLCGRHYDVLGVAALLFWETRYRGHVCPRCLYHQPAVAAHALMARRSRGAGGDEDIALAGEIAALLAWPLTVQDLMNADRAQLLQQYDFLSEADLNLLVEERYELLLL